MHATQPIAIVGQGIIGLSCALKLQEAGFSVTLFSKTPLASTTSQAAGAYWWPHKAYPKHQILEWSRASLQTYKTLSQIPQSGVHFEYHHRFCVIPDEQSDARFLLDDCLPIQGSDYGITCHEAFRLHLPVIDTPTFLPYLQQFVLSNGAQIIIQEIPSPRHLLNDFQVVVNCTGVHARTFANDPAVHPIRGQAVRLSPLPNYRDSWRLYEEHDNLTLVLPRSNDILLGGTGQVDNWDLQPKDEDTEKILDRCLRFQPQLADCAVLDSSVGLRPGRSSVRLEVESVPPNRAILHNYGHGGSGFTLAWGCAQEVIQLINQFYKRHP